MRRDCGLEVGHALAVAIRLLSIQAVAHTHGGTSRGCANFTRAAGCFLSRRFPDTPPEQTCATFISASIAQR
jgi:hypothetical protein